MAHVSTTLTSEPLPRQIGEKLSRLRRRIALWFAVDALSRLLLTMLVMIGVDLALDWWLAMDLPQRGVMLALAVAGLAWLVYRRFVRPLGYSFSDDALCLLVERHY